MRLLKPVRVIPTKLRSKNRIEQYTRDGDSISLITSPLRNDDTDNAFSEDVYTIIIEVQQGTPANWYTQPVATCTSMAVARALMQGADHVVTITRHHRSEMPDETTRLITNRERLELANPALATALKRRQTRLTRLLERQNSRQNNRPNSAHA